MIPFIDLKAQRESIGKEIETAVESVFRSGTFILGKRVEEFEAAFARYCGSRYSIAVANGTEALYLALAACGIGAGDEVITAPNTTAPTAAAIYMAGALPVYADIDSDTLTLDPKKIEKRISKRTKAVIPVHLYGNPADIDGVCRVAGKMGLIVIEDACQAHGASCNKRKAGSIGDLGCFSFYPTKNLGCYGDGGMIVTDNAKLASKLRRMRTYGEVKRYDYAERGINSRLDELQAAILIRKLGHLDEWNRKRSAIASLYDEMLAGTSQVKTQKIRSGCRSSSHLYVIQAEKRDALREYLATHGIQTLIHYPAPLYRVKPYAAKNKAKDFPVCEEVSRRILSLPIYPEMALADCRKVCTAINDFYLKRS